MEKRKERKNSWKRIIYCDPSYPQTTMQDFVINWARMRQQYAIAFKEDSLTKLVMRRITVTGAFFSYTRRYSNTTKFLCQDTLKLQALREAQACSATQDLPGRQFTPEEEHLLKKATEISHLLSSLTMCIYNGEIRRNPLDWKPERVI